MSKAAKVLQRYFGGLLVFTQLTNPAGALIQMLELESRTAHDLHTWQSSPSSSARQFVRKLLLCRCCLYLGGMAAICSSCLADASELPRGSILLLIQCTAGASCNLQSQKPETECATSCCMSCLGSAYTPWCKLTKHHHGFAGKSRQSGQQGLQETKGTTDRLLFGVASTIRHYTCTAFYALWT